MVGDKMHSLGIPCLGVRAVRPAKIFQGRRRKRGNGGRALFRNTYQAISHLQNPDVMAGLERLGNFLKDRRNGIGVLHLQLHQIETMD